VKFFSFIKFAENFKDSKIYCVDTWIGHEQYYKDKNFNEIEKNFDFNIKNYSNIIKIKSKSDTFFKENKDLEFDVIYIDGDHHHDQVLLDCLNAWTLLKKNGMLICDDYIWSYFDDIKKNPCYAINTFLRKIKDSYKQVFSPQTAYQVTSLLEGVIHRGTGKKLKKLKLNIAGKTGTTNENTDTWFIGYTTDLVIGVYVGMDNPKPLGKYETGSKTALPIFGNFIKEAVKKSDARPFKVADGITMMVVDPSTGQKAKFSSKNTIIEAYKSKNVVNGNVLYSNNNRLDINNILKFY